MTVITGRDVTDFTMGGCYLLAGEVEAVTGWPCAAFWDGFRAAGHVFNAMPDSRYLDIRGVHSRAAMMASRWGHARGRHGITVRYIDTFGWSCGLDESALRARARALAPALLASLFETGALTDSSVR